MRYLGIIAPLSVSFLATPLHAEPANPGTQCVETAANGEAFKLGRQIVETIIPADSGDAMMRQMMGAILNQMRSGMNLGVDDPGAQAILDKHLKRIPDFLGPLVAKFLPHLKEATACAYTHEFSVGELREIAGFAASPSGKHYLSRSTALLSDPAVAQANQAYFAELQVASGQFQKQLTEELEAYFKTSKARKN